VSHAFSSDPPPATGADATPDALDVTIREVGMERLSLIRDLNVQIFGEERIINSFDRADVLILLATTGGALGDGGTPVGFKLGYRLHQEAFYSAKGGVLPRYRRRGVARRLLHAMIERVRADGYRRFVFDTFPNMHPGMTILGLREGFAVTKAGYSPQYDDYRLRMEREV
jgi:GNAT superfamily N-acetyltransferase